MRLLIIEKIILSHLCRTKSCVEKQCLIAITSEGSKCTVISPIFISQSIILIFCYYMYAFSGGAKSDAINFYKLLYLAYWVGHTLEMLTMSHCSGNLRQYSLHGQSRRRIAAVG